MKIAQRVVGFVVVGFLCSTAAHAQSDVALRYELQAGAGSEYISGTGYAAPSRMMETVGLGVSWASPIQSLRLSLGGDAEWHPNNSVASCTLPAGPRINCTQTVGAPSLGGGQAVVGARYNLSPRLSVGMAVGAGYLGVTGEPGSNKAAGGPSGSYVRSIMGTVEYAATDHITFVAQGEQYEMPDFGGTYMRSRPVSLLARFR